MSLDVYLTVKGAQRERPSGIPIREDGRIKVISRAEWDERHPGREPMMPVSLGSTDEVYSANITHNLGQMAGQAEIYECLWRPDEIGVETAGQLIKPLRQGLALLKGDPLMFMQFNPANGWGNYEGLVSFVREYLAACEEHPGAEVSVWR